MQEDGDGRPKAPDGGHHGLLGVQDLAKESRVRGAKSRLKSRAVLAAGWQRKHLA